MSQTIDPNKQYFYDGKIAVGALAYYGLPNQDPKVEANQIKIYADRETTIEISQPQQTDDQGILPPVFVQEQLYSFKVETAPEQNSEQITLQLELEPLNGVGLVVNDIDMNNHKHLNVTEATENNQYLTLGQSYRKFPQGVVSDPASLENALVANLPIAPDALLFGQPIRLYLDGVPANSTNAVTLKLGVFAAKQLYKGNNLPLDIGDTWGPGAFLDLIYDDVLDKFQFLNPRSAQNAKDSELLQGQNGAHYLDRANHTGTQDFNSTTTGLVPLARMDNDSVGQGQVIAGAIHTGELSTSTTQDDFTIPSSPFGLYVDRNIMSGGQYGFQPRTQNQGPDTGSTEQVLFLYSADDNGIFGLGQYITMVGLTPGSIGYDGRAITRFIDSSAPWNMGHGDIALFVFLKLNSDGEVIGAQVSPAPVWGYNGKTSIIPDRVSNVLNAQGEVISVKKFKKIIDPDVEANLILPPWQGGDPAQWNVQALDAYLEQQSNPSLIEVEIDHSLKNKDMHDLPHPFVSMQEGDTVVLLDPCSPVVDKLADLHKNEVRIRKLFNEGYLELGEELDCTAPVGVKVLSVNWKFS